MILVFCCLFPLKSKAKDPVFEDFYIIDSKNKGQNRIKFMYNNKNVPFSGIDKSLRTAKQLQKFYHLIFDVFLDLELLSRIPFTELG